MTPVRVRAGRAAGLAVLGVLLAAGLAPFVLREEPAAAPAVEAPTVQVGRPAPAGTILLAGSVDALAAAARDRGYTCLTPEVRTIRSCSRAADGYTDQLWMDGDETAVVELSLEVQATYRTQTRRRWLEEMALVLGGLGTEQGRNLAAWVAQHADAPRAEGSVDGLSVLFFARTGTYTKETFGHVSAR